MARTKPIVALKAGATAVGARAASSHTAALAGSDAAVDALFRDTGVIRARTLEELIDAAVLFSSQPLPRGRNVAVVTNAGGLGILCADACDAVGLELPELGEETQAALAGSTPRRGDALQSRRPAGLGHRGDVRGGPAVVLEDSHVDALIALFVPPVVADVGEVGAAILRAVETTPSDKPVLATVLSADGTPAVLRARRPARRCFRTRSRRRGRWGWRRIAQTGFGGPREASARSTASTLDAARAVIRGDRCR